MGGGRISSNKTGNALPGNKLVKASAVLVIEKKKILRHTEAASCRSGVWQKRIPWSAGSIRTHSEQSAESGRRNDSIFKAELLMKSAESMRAPADNKQSAPLTGLLRSAL